MRGQPDFMEKQKKRIKLFHNNFNNFDVYSLKYSLCLTCFTFVCMMCQLGSVLKIALDKLWNNTLSCQQSCYPFELGSLNFMFINVEVLRTSMGSYIKQAQKFQTNKTNLKFKYQTATVLIALGLFSWKHCIQIINRQVQMVDFLAVHSVLTRPKLQFTFTSFQLLKFQFV